MKALIQKFLKDESGATMVEYGIMIALIAAVAIAAVVILGGYVNDSFTAVNTTLGDNLPAAPAD